VGAVLLLGNLPSPEGFTDDDRKELFYTFLLIGLDGGVNTDTIMVASYDAVKMEGNVISIPRDSLENVQRRVRKINAAYPAGTLFGGGRDGGIA
jgi:anionic cell wall polymer biosynthesis LytR-Cps2A-Psr (LCP) family protein